MASITVTLPTDTEQRLREKADALGLLVEAYLRQLIETDLTNGAQPYPGERTLEETLAPFRQAFAKSGMTEDELAALVEEARAEIWQEKQARKQGS